MMTMHLQLLLGGMCMLCVNGQLNPYYLGVTTLGGYMPRTGGVRNSPSSNNPPSSNKEFQDFLMQSQLYLMATFLQLQQLGAKQRVQPVIKTKKRHCWNVFDMCCTANVCGEGDMRER